MNRFKFGKNMTCKIFIKTVSSFALALEYAILKLIVSNGKQIKPWFILKIMILRKEL